MEDQWYPETDGCSPCHTQERGTICTVVSTNCDEIFCAQAKQHWRIKWCGDHRNLKLMVGKSGIRVKLPYLVQALLPAHAHVVPKFSESGLCVYSSPSGPHLKTGGPEYNIKCLSNKKVLIWRAQQINLPWRTRIYAINSTTKSRADQEFYLVYK